MSLRPIKADDKPSQWEVDETVRFKELYDQDKDGQLNREEQLRWVAPNSYVSAREEVRTYTLGQVRECQSALNDVNCLC